MKIKLTDAQSELLDTHPDFTPIDGALEIEDSQLATLIADIDEACAALDAMPYTPVVGRARFAARALAKKLHKLAEPPQQEQEITIGMTVYLPGSKHHTYTVKSFNTDGSICVYGGENAQYRKFCDFHRSQITTIRPG